MGWKELKILKDWRRPILGGYIRPESGMTWETESWREPGEDNSSGERKTKHKIL